MSVTLIKSGVQPNKEGYPLNPKQINALPLIVSGMSHVDVAKEIGVSEWTISNWTNHSPEFKQAMKTELELVTDRARRLLAANAVQAAQRLIDTAKSGSGSANTTKASQLILDRVGIVGPDSGGLEAAGVDSQTQALVQLIQQRRAEKELKEVADES